jgi:TPR repeat protein
LHERSDHQTIQIRLKRVKRTQAMNYEKLWTVRAANPAVLKVACAGRWMLIRLMTAAILVLVICCPNRYGYAIDPGATRALVGLGWQYERGQGVPQSYKKAAELYEKAAVSGDAGGQAALASLYCRGLGVPKDYRRALELAQKSAAQGNAAGQNTLGVLYRNGWGVKQDFKKAAELYTKAANQGSTMAMTNLAWLYTKGLGVPQDDKKAAQLYEKAIVTGYRDSNEVAPNTRLH